MHYTLNAISEGSQQVYFSAQFIIEKPKVPLNSFPFPDLFPDVDYLSYTMCCGHALIATDHVFDQQFAGAARFLSPEMRIGGTISIED